MFAAAAVSCLPFQQTHTHRHTTHNFFFFVQKLVNLPSTAVTLWFRTDGMKWTTVHDERGEHVSSEIIYWINFLFDSMSLQIAPRTTVNYFLR